MTGNAIRKAVTYFCRQELRCPVFDLWVAPEETACPYVAIGNGRDDTKYLKTGQEGRYSLVLHFWYDRPLEDQPAMIEAMEKTLEICSRLSIPDKDIRLIESAAYQLYDTAGATPYLHGVLELKFKY